METNRTAPVPETVPVKQLNRARWQERKMRLRSYKEALRVSAVTGEPVNKGRQGRTAGT